MKFILLACGLAAGLGLGPPSANAQTPTLAQAVDSTWQRAVASREIAGQVQRASAELELARSFWSAPPVLEIGHRDDRLQSNRGASETELGLAMPLWLPGQRATRLQSAQADVDASDAARAAGRLRVAALVRETAWNAALQRSDLDLAQARWQAFDKLSADVARRVQAGELARADAMAAQAELLGAASAVNQARQQVQATMQSWTALTGLSSIPAAAEPPAAVEPEEHPYLRAARLQLEAARRRADAVSASRVASPELIARVRQDVSGRTEPTSKSFGLAVRIPLGTADRNRPLMAAALAEVDVAEAAHLQQRDQLLADLAIARSAQAGAEQQLRDEQARAALLSERASLLEKSFAAGESALPETLRALTAAQEAQAAVKRQEVALGLARARVLQAQGVTP